MAIVLVQTTAAGAQSVDGTTTTMQLDFTNNVTAGNFVVALVSCWNHANGAVSAAITGETFAEYHKDDSVAAPDNGRVHILYVVNAVGGAKVLTITSAGTSGNTFMNGIAYEFSGVATSSATDSHNIVSDAQTGTSISTGALTPDAANELFMAIAEATTSNVTYTDTTSGWTLAFNQKGNSAGGTGQGGIAWYRIATDAAAQTATATISASDAWGAVIAAVKTPAVASAGFRSRITLLGVGP